MTRALGITAPPAVEEFLQRLEMAAAVKDWEVVVFFDGPERYLRREAGLLTVRYAVGRSADSLIERMIYQSRDRVQVVVVTQDRAEANLVQGFGAQVWSPQRLVEELRQEPMER